MHKLFDSSDPHGYIVLNYRNNPIEELSEFAEGYHNAAKRLTKIMKDSSGYPDYDGYPIVFLYRHSLELYLKAVVYKGAKYLELINSESDDIHKLFKNHNLISLFRGCKAIFDGLGWSWELDTPKSSSFEDLQNVIIAFHEIDPGSFNYRYPIDNKGNEAVEPHTVINVVKLAEIMDQILPLLDGAALKLDYEFDFQIEQKYEFQGIFEEMRNAYE